MACGRKPGLDVGRTARPKVWRVYRRKGKKVKVNADVALGLT